MRVQHARPLLPQGSKTLDSMPFDLRHGGGYRFHHSAVC
jgi:hypothetical protein